MHSYKLPKEPTANSSAYKTAARQSLGGRGRARPQPRLNQPQAQRQVEEPPRSTPGE